jgi:anhydro-N-acetylmuramic acid kinase
MKSPAAAPFVGLISGTSMDAVDAVVVDLREGAPPALLATLSHPIPAPLHARLRTLADPAGSASVDELGLADVLVGELFAEAALKVIAVAGLAPADIVAIGSHGQTVRHRPEAHPPFTLQIGSAPRIAVRTGITTVANFREADMAAGGQGAPLVPAFHRAAFSSPHDARAVVNIGGIANLTCLPPAGSGAVTGFDTGPGNTLLDHWTGLHRQAPYDAEGRWARQGQVSHTLLDILLADPYLHATAPKSTGPEYFSPDWLNRALARVGEALAPVDVQRTLVEFTARHITDAVAGHPAGATRVLVCGGGAHNRLLMERLAALMPERQVADTGAFGIDPDWVEAIAFAWLAKEGLHGRPGNIREVTGAREDVILGGIFPGIYKRKDPGDK